MFTPKGAGLRRASRPSPLLGGVCARSLLKLPVAGGGSIGPIDVPTDSVLSAPEMRLSVELGDSFGPTFDAGGDWPREGGTTAAPAATASTGGGVRTRAGGSGGGLRLLELRDFDGSATSELGLRGALLGLRLWRSFDLAMSTVSLLPSPRVDHHPPVRLSVAMNK